MGEASVELEQPLEVDVDVDNMELTRLAVTDATVRVTGLGPDSAGQVKGSLTAELDLSDFNLNGQVTASAGGFSFGDDLAHFTLSEVSLTGTVTKSTLGTVSLKADTRVDVLGDNPFSMGGTIEGTYDGQKERLTTGTAAVSLKSNLPLKAEGGDTLTILEGTKVAAHVAANKLTQLTAEAKAEYARGGAVVLAGTIPSASYDVASKKASGTGTLTLKSKLEYRKDDTVVSVAAPASVTATVTQNVLERGSRARRRSTCCGRI